MSQKTARVLLGCVGFFSIIAVIFLAYHTRLSGSYLLGVLAGLGLGVGMIMGQSRATSRGYTREHTHRIPVWLWFVPAISATAAGLIRTLGSSDFQVFVMATTSSMIAIFLPWVVFVFSAPRTNTAQRELSATEGWRANQEQYAREQAESRERYAREQAELRERYRRK